MVSALDIRLWLVQRRNRASRQPGSGSFCGAPPTCLMATHCVGISASDHPKGRVTSRTAAAVTVATPIESSAAEVGRGRGAGMAVSAAVSVIAVKPRDIKDV